jgi:hypothetical protein
MRDFGLIVAGLRHLPNRLTHWRVGLRWYLIYAAGTAALTFAGNLVQSRLAHTALAPLLDFAAFPSLAWYGVKMMIKDSGPIAEAVRPIGNPR